MLIIAHRGASCDAPENTLASARLAWTQHADALECDVHLTKDGHLAVVHDDDTKRTAGRALKVNDATMSELKQLEVGRWKSASYAAEKIPELSELLALVPPDKRIFIEIKGGPEAVAALDRCLAQSDLAPEQIGIISFDPDALAAAKRAMPRFETSWILEKNSASASLPFDEIPSRCRSLGFDGLDLEATWPIDSSLVQRIHEAGLKIYVWTVDDAPTAHRLATAGVDGITTNRPGWLREVLAHRAPAP